MQIRFKGIHYDLPATITERAQKKLSSIRKYLGRDADTARAYVELGKISEAHQTGPIWQALINFSFRGGAFRAEAVEETIENALDRATGELAKEVRRSKKKQESLIRRGGALFKMLSQRFA